MVYGPDGAFSNKSPGMTIETMEFHSLEGHSFLGFQLRIHLDDVAQGGPKSPVRNGVRTFISRDVTPVKPIL